MKNKKHIERLEELKEYIKWIDSFIFNKDKGYHAYSEDWMRTKEKIFKEINELESKLKY